MFDFKSKGKTAKNVSLSKNTGPHWTETKGLTQKQLPILILCPNACDISNWSHQTFNCKNAKINEAS